MESPREVFLAEANRRWNLANRQGSAGLCVWLERGISYINSDGNFGFVEIVHVPSGTDQKIRQLFPIGAEGTLVACGETLPIGQVRVWIFLDASCTQQGLLMKTPCEIPTNRAFMFYRNRTVEYHTIPTVPAGFTIQAALENLVPEVRQSISDMYNTYIQQQKANLGPRTPCGKYPKVVENFVKVSSWELHIPAWIFAAVIYELAPTHNTAKELLDISSYHSCLFRSPGHISYSSIKSRFVPGTLKPVAIQGSRKRKRDQQSEEESTEEVDEVEIVATSPKQAKQDENAPEAIIIDD